MRLLSLISILFILTSSCQRKIGKLQTLDFGVFQLKTPQGWKIVKEQSIDSYYGGLTNGKDSLWFDYGRYGVNLSNGDTHKYLFAKDTLNGFPARVTKPDTTGKGYVSMVIPKVTDINKFTIWGVNIQETEIILNIYKSLYSKIAIL